MVDAKWLKGLEGAEVGGVQAPSTLEAALPAALDALVIELYVELDDFLGLRHRGAGRPPKLTDAELNHAGGRAGAVGGPPTDRQSCGQSGETARRSEFAGSAGYGHRRSHSRWFAGLGCICSAPATECRSASHWPPPTSANIGLRLLALAAGIWHNHLTGHPARAFAAYRR